MKNLILIYVLLMLSASLLHAAPISMPIGVPEPTFDYDLDTPPSPEKWENPIAGYYFVDFANGADSSNDFGTPNAPRSTIPYPVPAGSLVVVRSEYFHTLGGVIKIDSAGNGGVWVPGVSGPVFIVTSQGYGGAFIKSKVVISGNNLFLDGFTVKDGSLIQVGSSAVGYPAQHIVVRNCEIIGRLTDGNGTRLMALGTPDSRVSNIMFHNNIIRDSGDINSPVDIDAHLVGVGGYVSDFWLLGNKMYNASGSGFQANGGPPREFTYNIFVGQNEVYNVRQSGLWVKYAKNVVFSQNHIHDIIDTAWSPAKGMGAQYEPEGLWMLYNKIHGVSFGIRVASTASTVGVEWPIYIVGNAIYDVNSLGALTGKTSWESAGIHLQGGYHRHIYNNVIFDAPNGINGSGTIGNYNIYNNVIANISSPLGNHLWIEGSLSLAAIDNNIFSQPDGDVRFGWGSSIRYTLPELIAGAGVCGNCKSSLLNFRDASSGNFELLDPALVVDKGFTYVKLVNEMSKALGKNLIADTLAAGSSMELVSERVLGDSIDIGIFEYGAGRKPNPPSSLLID